MRKGARLAARLVFWDQGKIMLDLRTRMHMFRLAQIARACGRVSVSGDPDKRPVNRSEKPAAGANRRTPPNGGRDLKQRRTGLFRLCRPLQRPAYRRGLSLLPGVRTGFPPFQAVATENRIGVMPSRLKLPTALHLIVAEQPIIRRQRWRSRSICQHGSRFHSAAHES